MENHPCVGCINNWSGDIIGCADYCEERDNWKKEHPSNQKGDIFNLIPPADINQSIISC